MVEVAALDSCDWSSQNPTSLRDLWSCPPQGAGWDSVLKNKPEEPHHNFKAIDEEILRSKPAISISQEEVIPSQYTSAQYISKLNQLEESSYKYKREVCKRIRYLTFPLDDDKDLDWPDVNFSSLSNLIKFFINEGSYFIPCKKPNHVLTDKGNLRSIWRISKNKFFGLEYIPNGMYRFVIFSPSDNPNKKVNSKSGECDRRELNNLIKNYGWLK